MVLLGCTPTADQGHGSDVTVTDAGAALPAGVTLTTWRPLAPGVRLRRGHATSAFEVPDTERAQDLTVVDIDLATPGLHFVTNPAGGRDDPARPGHQVNATGGSLTQLIAARPEVLVAVNANFFWPCCARPDPTAGSAEGAVAGEPTAADPTSAHPLTPPPSAIGMTLFGLAVDDGRIVSDPARTQLVAGCPPVPAVPDHGSVGAPALLIDRANHVSFAVMAATDPIPADLAAAVAGGPQPDGTTPPPCGPYDGYPPGRPVPGPAFLLRDGQTETVARARPPEIVAGRTFVGTTADHHLLLATVDGSETGGAAFADEAAWLQLLGAREGLNLDGGGSTSMAIDTAGVADPPPGACPQQGGTVELLDVPDNGGRCHERLIGTYLGVIAPRS